jgi:lantibiotic biosynthesis protein
MNRLLGGSIGDLLEMGETSGLARRWFFLRYTDPEPHLRIRWQGDPDVLLRHLMPHVAALADRLIQSGHLSRFVIDTYERELERYAGPQGTDVSEDVFHADSRAVHQLLSLPQPLGGLDLTELATLTVQDLLAGLGLNEQGRLAFYERQVGSFADETLRRNAGADYRKRKSRLRRILGANRIEAIDPSGKLESILAARRGQLELAARQLSDLAESGSLTNTLDNLHASYVHMHLNRLVGAFSAPSEGHVLHLLSRAQRSLVVAPVSPGEGPEAERT